MSSKNVNSFSTIDTINTYSNSSLLGIVSGNLTRLTSGNLVLNKVNASNLIYNTGNQNIDGLKDFTIRPTVGTIPVLLSGDIPYVQTNSYFYVDATRTDSYIENGNILYPYKTLSGAYNAAKNIAYFHNPTYITLLSPIAENLTIDKGYINLVGNNTNKNDPIRITGSLVFAATGIGSTITDNNFSIAGLGVTATSNNKCILFSGNNPQRLFIQDCWLIAKDNGTCLYSNNTNTTSRLQGDILKLSPEGVNTTAIDIVSGTSSISFAETSSSASVLAYVRNNSTLNISNSQIETNGVKAFQVENTARLTLLNSVLTNTANPSTGIFLKDAFSTAVVVGSAISVPANANSYAINGVANSYLFYKNLYFSIDAIGGSTESKIGNNVNKNLINSYDPVVYSIGDQTISGIKTFDVFPIVSGNKLITGVDLNAYATVANLFATGSNLDNKINSLSGVAVLTFGNQTISGVKTFANSGIFSLSNTIPLSLPNNPLSIVGSGNTYVQFNIQNRSTGTNATADLVITANNGTDSSNFINLGINNSGYNDPAFSNGTGLDGYLFINGGNLDIGTQTPGTSVEFHVGGTTSNDSILRVTRSGIDLSTGCNIYGANSYQRINADIATTALPATRLSFNLEGGKVYEVDQYFRFTPGLANSNTATTTTPVNIPCDGYRFGINTQTPFSATTMTFVGDANNLTNTAMLGDITGVAHHIRKGILRPTQNSTINFQAGSHNGVSTTLVLGSYVIVKKLT